MGDLIKLETRLLSARRLLQIFQIYSVIGLAIGCVAMAYFFLRRYQIVLSEGDQTILLIAGSGFAVSIISTSYLLIRRLMLRAERERRKTMESAADLLQEWARFEAIGQRRLQATGMEFNALSIRYLIAKLNDYQILPASARIPLEEALQLRNRLVHQGADIAESQLARSIQSIPAIVTHLETDGERSTQALSAAQSGPILAC